MGAELAAPSPDFREVATIGRGNDITRPYIDPMGQLLLPQDEILLLKGGLGYEAYRLYEKVLQDDQVYSTLQQRFRSVTSCDWEVLPGKRRGRSNTRADRAAADFVQEQLEQACSWDDVTSKALYGLFYGYSVSELIYGRDGRYVCLDADRGGIAVRHRRRFRFDYDKRPKLVTNSNALGEALPDYKFWVFSVGGDNSDDPYGRGLGHWLYWPVWFKRNDLKFWLFFLEKFGMPTAKGTYRQGASATEQAKLLSCLQAILTDSGIILPEGMDVSLIEAQRSGSADYGAVYDRMDAAIAKINLSQTMTTDDGSSRAQAQVHENVAESVTKGDSDLINGSFNQGPVRWLIDYNRPALGDCTYPTVWRRCEPEEDLNNRAERDKLLFDMGYRLNAEEVESVYGEGYELMPTPPSGHPSQEGNPTPAPVGAQGIAPTDLTPSTPPEALTPSPSPNTGRGEPEAAMGARPDTVDLLLPRLQREANPAMQGMIATLRRQWEQFKDQPDGIAQFRRYLERAYTDFDGSALEAALAQTMTTARYAGIYEAQEGE